MVNSAMKERIVAEVSAPDINPYAPSEFTQFLVSVPLTATAIAQEHITPPDYGQALVDGPTDFLPESPGRYFGQMKGNEFEVGSSNSMAFCFYVTYRAYDANSRTWQTKLDGGRTSFVFTIKPSTLRVNESAISSPILTKEGWESFHREQHGITSLMFGGTSGNIQPTGGSLIGDTSGVSSPNPNIGYSQVDVRETGNWQKFWQMRAFWRTFHGEIGLWYCGVLYWGRLVTFNFEENAEKPFEITYDFKFEAYPYSGFNTQHIYDGAKAPKGTVIQANAPQYKKIPASAKSKSVAVDSFLVTNSPDEGANKGKMYLGTKEFPFGVRTLDLDMLWTQRSLPFPRGVVHVGTGDKQAEAMGSRDYALLSQRSFGLSVQQLREQRERNAMDDANYTVPTIDEAGIG